MCKCTAPTLSAASLCRWVCRKRNRLRGILFPRLRRLKPRLLLPIWARSSSLRGRSNPAAHTSRRVGFAVEAVDLLRWESIGPHHFAFIRRRRTPALPLRCLGLFHFHFATIWSLPRLTQGSFQPVSLPYFHVPIYANAFTILRSP